MFVFRKCERQRAIPIAKASGENAAILRRLRSFLDPEEPKIVKWLHSLWKEQQNAITYKELLAAALSGEVTQETLDRWFQDYTRFVNTNLVPLWEKAMAAGAADRMRAYPYYLYDPNVSFAQIFVRDRAAELIVNLAEEQRNAIRSMVARATHYDAVTPDILATVMRPAIGLYPRQAVANINLYNTVREALLKENPLMRLATAEKRAKEAAARYAAQQHRYRAMSIARTELASAYNAGGFAATQDARNQGLIGDCKKTWLAADDERMCSACGGADGESVNMDDRFRNGVLLPPAHPSCRCTVAYEEISGAVMPIAPVAPVVSPPPTVPPQATSGTPILQPGTAPAIINTDQQLLNDFKDQLDTLPQMPSSYKRDLANRFSAGSEDARRVYVRHVGPNSVADGAAKSTAHYKPGSNQIYMNYASDKIDRRGSGNTFFHEHGHYIDWNSRATRTDPVQSRKTPAFGQAIRDDIKALEKAIKSQYGVRRKADIYRKMASDMLSQYKAEDINGISDIIEGVAKIPSPMGYGHGVSYWNSMPVEVEAFAHMFAAQFDAKKLEAIRRYLPNTLAEFEMLLKGII